MNVSERHSPTRFAEVGTFTLLWIGVVILFFWRHLFAGASLLTLDVLHQGYLPWAAAGSPFDPQNHFESDSVNLLLQYKTLGAEALYQPYWNPYSMGGVPEYANPYASHFALWNWLFAIFPASQAYLGMVIAHFGIAAGGMYALLRTQGVAIAWARFGALAFAFSGPMITMSMRWWVPGALAWGCWALWSMERRKAWTPLFLAFAILEGFLQTTVFLGIATLGWSFALPSARREKLLRWALDWSVACGIAAIALVPQLEYMLHDIAKGQSRISHEGFEKSLMERLLSIPFLFGAWLPEVWGTVRTLDLTKLIRTHLQDFAPFFGTITVTLTVLSCHARVWQARPVARGWLVLLMLGLVLPIFTPLDRVLYFRFLIVAVWGAIGLAVHFASGLEEAEARESGRRALRRASLVLGGVAILLSAMLVAWAGARGFGPFSEIIGSFELGFLSNVSERAREAGGIFPSRFPEWISARASRWLGSWRGFTEGPLSLGLTGVLGLSTAAFWFWMASREKVGFRVGARVATALVVFQLAVFGARWFPAVDVARYPPPTPTDQADWVTSIRRSVGDGRLLVEGVHPGRREIFPNNLGSLLQIATLNGFDGLKPFTVLQLVRGSADYRGLGVTSVLRFNDAPVSAQAEAVEAFGEIALDRLRSPLGLARIVSGYEWADNPEQALQRAWSLGFDGPSVVLEAEKSVGRLGFASSPGAQGEAQTVRRTPNLVELKLRSDRPGLLVVAETWYPGWRAEVNGNVAPVLRAQRALRAVEIPAGESTVIWKFEPVSYRLGMGISFAMLSLWAGLMLWHRRAQRAFL